MSVPINSAITFLFTDIEGSTRLWEDYPEAMRSSLERHDRMLRRAIDDHGGEIFKTGGDGFCAAFREAHRAVEAALRSQLALTSASWEGLPGLRVRIAIHSGSAQEREGDYFGPALNCISRILEAGAGGQVLLSLSTAETVREQLPLNAQLFDLGLHRLRDLQRPERVYQLLHPELPSDFPPLRTQGGFQHNLPEQLNSFVGREAELETARDILKRSRLLTLTGAGGSGKTRLALQVGTATLDRYRDGVWLAELAGLNEPSAIAQAIASAVGIREEPGIALLDTLTEHFRPKETLLILDNCEHLLDGAAFLSNQLLKSCPGIRILATSRQPLGIAGEIAWIVPPLAAPDPTGIRKNAFSIELLERFESVKLFIDRASAALPSFKVTPENAQAIARICHRLDGIPLAIELAAARVKVLTAQQIASRLDDRFRLLAGGDRSALPRQQTLRALIDWSYDLLTEAEKRMLRRLCVFSGGCTLEAAERLWDDEDLPVVEVLSQLVDKSLARMEEGMAGEPRYRLSETMREYGRERLVATGELREVESQHRQRFTALAEIAEPRLQGPDQELWLDRLEWERDNLRTAIENSEATGEALRIGGALWRFWFVRGYFTEGRALLESTLTRRSASNEPVDNETLAKALKGVGNLAWVQGDVECAGRYHEESLALYRLAGNQNGVAGELNNLANLARDQGMLERAQELYDQSLSIYRDLNDAAGIAMALTNLGGIAMERKDYPEARRLLTEGLEIHRARGDSYAEAACHHNLGDIARSLGQFEEAHNRFVESLKIRWQIGDKSIVGLSLMSLANVDFKLGKLERATCMLGAVANYSEDPETPLVPADRVEFDEIVAGLRSAMPGEHFDLPWRRGYGMSLDCAIRFALSHPGGESGV